MIQPTGDSNIMIRMDQVTRVFGDTRAVDCVSLQVHAGEVLGFIGPNGAGKTTSMRILSTLDLPTSGDAWIDGFSVTNCLLYTSPSPRDKRQSRMPSSA